MYQIPLYYKYYLLNRAFYSFPYMTLNQVIEFTCLFYQVLNDGPLGFSIFYKNFTFIVCIFVAFILILRYNLCK